MGSLSVYRLIPTKAHIPRSLRNDGIGLYSPHFPSNPHNTTNQGKKT